MYLIGAVVTGLFGFVYFPLIDTAVPWLVFLGGVGGLLGGLALQYWISVIDYPLNIGGRPLASWPNFVIPAYETTILCASITAVSKNRRESSRTFAFRCVPILASLP